MAALILTPNLEFLSFVRFCEGLRFNNSPKLKKVGIYMGEELKKEALEVIEASGVFVHCGRLPVDESLEVDHFYGKVSFENDDSDMVVKELEGFSKIPFDHLRQVKLGEVFGLKSELEFIKLILAKYPMSEKVIIEPDSELGVWFFKELSRFQRASTLVEIAYKT